MKKEKITNSHNDPRLKIVDEELIKLSHEIKKMDYIHYRPDDPLIRRPLISKEDIKKIKNLGKQFNTLMDQRNNIIEENIEKSIQRID